jgi:Phage integrase family
MRHSAAWVMLSAGVPLKVVLDVFGHASVAITGDIYGHVSPEVSREALIRLSEPSPEKVSSSTTRLTNQFRYLLDMINIVRRGGWFRAAAFERRVKGSWSRLGR